MSLFALSLVLAAAFIHAGWNLLAKRLSAAGHQGAPVVFLLSLGATVVYGPAVWWVLRDGVEALSPTAWLVLLASAVLHYGYVTVLQRGYQVGDLSVVYPLARGSGPLLASLVAILVLGERPTPLSLVGIGLIVSGVLAVAGVDRLLRGHGRGALQRGAGWGLLTGAFIAAYTVVDGYAVKVLLVTPLLVDYASNALRVLLAAPLALMQREALREGCTRYWKTLLAIATLSPLSYILVLTAMQSAPISHIAPAREVSMLIAAWLGGSVLGEGALRRRLLASSLIVAGVVALALA